MGWWDGKAIRFWLGGILLAGVLAIAACPGAISQTDNDFEALARQVDGLRDQGKYAEAVEITKRSLAFAERKFGTDHTHVATALNNIAELYRIQGRYAEAEPLYKRALDIREKALGPDHPDVGQSLNDLAALYASQGRYAEAEPLYKRGLAIAKRHWGLTIPTSVPRSTISPRCTEPRAGMPRPSPRTSARSPSARRRSAPTTPTSAQPQQSRRLYPSQGRYAEAEPLYQARPWRSARRRWGPTTPMSAPP